MGILKMPKLGPIDVKHPELSIAVDAMRKANVTVILLVDIDNPYVV
jgi:hypothetical protein